MANNFISKVQISKQDNAEFKIGAVKLFNDTVGENIQPFESGNAFQPIYFSNGIPIPTDFEWTQNEKDKDGFVPAPTSTDVELVWKTDAEGQPSWGFFPQPLTDEAIKNACVVDGSVDDTNAVLVKLDPTLSKPGWAADAAAVANALGQKSNTGHTHSYAGSSYVGGPATSADKLNTNAGGVNQPVYFNNGIPQAVNYTIGVSVPSNAKFTDTTYEPATQSSPGLMSATDKVKLDGIIIDSALSATSTNPVQNKEIVSKLVQKTTKINGKALSGDISLTFTDVGADKNGAAEEALTAANTFTQEKFDEILGTGAVESLNTLGEISKALKDNANIVDTLNASIGTKANKDGTNATGTWGIDTTGRANTAGVAEQATKLQNARSLQVNLSTADAVDFDGSKAISIGATGTLPLSHGGTGAITAEGALLKLGITATANELNQTEGVTENIQSQLDARLQLAGGTMLGHITLSQDPIDNAHVVHKKYVDDAVSGMTHTTVFNADGSITTTYINDKVETTVFNSDGSITETVTENEQSKIKTTSFNPDGSITVLYA